MLLDAAVHASGASKKLISPSYLLRWQSGKKYEIRAVDKKNANGKKQSKAKNSTEDRVHREVILFSEINCVATASPYQIACAAQFRKLSSLAAAASS